MSVEEAITHERWQEPPSSLEVRRSLLDRLGRRVLIVTASLYAAGFARSLVLSRSLGLPLDTVSGPFDYIVAAGGMSAFQVAIYIVRALSSLPWWFNIPAVIILMAILTTFLKKTSMNKVPLPRPPGWTDVAVATYNRIKYRSDHWLTTFIVTGRLYILFAAVVATGVISASLMLQSIRARLIIGVWQYGGSFA